MTIWKSEWSKFTLLAIIFLICFWLPTGNIRFDHAVLEAMHLLRWYAREHVLLCLVPAFFIAGAIAVFISQTAVMKYLGPKANKVIAYGVASVSGSILAVCSCTVLPLFAGIYRMGAGLGPAVTFLYAGPAINVLAIILTARILGLELGIARAVGAIVFSIVIGLIMHMIYRNENADTSMELSSMDEEQSIRPLWQNVLYFGGMIGILVFANWGKPDQASGIWHVIWSSKWIITTCFSISLAIILIAWFGMRVWKMLVVAGAVFLAWMLTKIWIEPNIASANSHALPWSAIIPFTMGIVGLSLFLGVRPSNPQAGEWLHQTWGYAKLIVPLLFIGVLVAGFLLGRPGEEGVIPSHWISSLVGGNSVQANLFASCIGAFMYFATLTEVPILEGLIGNGMGKGPALALLLAGPALSLPNMLVIRSIMGTQKTLIFVALVILMATISGIIYGACF